MNSQNYVWRLNMLLYMGNQFVIPEGYKKNELEGETC